MQKESRGTESVDKNRAFSKQIPPVGVRCISFFSYRRNKLMSKMMEDHVAVVQGVEGRALLVF